MERKSNNTAVVTEEQVATGLATADTTPREEQVLRMRYGAKVETKAPLAQAHGGNEALGDELLLIEMSLLRGLKARRGQTTAATSKNAVKSKIAAKLGKK